MEEYVENTKKYLNGRRDMKRRVYRIVATLYRAVKSNRITWEQGLQYINNLGGIANANN